MSNIDNEFQPSEADSAAREQDAIMPPVEHAKSHSSKSNNSRRLVPVYVATVLSVIWVTLAIYWSFSSQAFSNVDQSFSDIGALIAGLTTPLVVIWLILLAFQRSDPLLERRLAMSQSLHKAMAPIEEAEQRLGELNKNLTKELINIEAVADLASDRIGNLENRFQDQISDLFNATADTEARTSSIRETLERERGSIGDLTNDIEERFKNLESKIESMTGTLSIAGDKAADVAKEAQEATNTHTERLIDVTLEMESRLASSGKGLADRADKVQEMTVDMELRLQSVGDNIHSGVDKMRHDVHGLEERSAELAEHMKTQGRVLTELAELAAIESGKIEDTLKMHVEEVKGAAEDALSRTSEVSELFSDRATQMSATVIDTVNQAKDLLDDAGKTLDQHCEEALSTSGELNERAMEQTRETASAVKEHAEEINRLLVASLEQAKFALDETATSITKHAETAETTTKDAADRALQHLRQLQAGVEDEIKSLEDVATTSGENLASTAQLIADEAGKLSNEAHASNTQLKESHISMAERGETLEGLMSAARANLLDLEAELQAHGQNLSDTTESATSQLIDASSRFKQETQAIEETGKRTDSSLRLASETLKVEQDRLLTSGKQASDEMAASVDALKGTASDLQTSVQTTSETLDKATVTFSQERDRIRVETDDVVEKLGDASQEIITRVDSLTSSSNEAANRLEGATQILMDETEHARVNIKSAVTDASENLKQDVQDMGDQAAEKITVMQEDMQATIARLLLDYKDAADAAEKESALLSVRIGKEADKVAERAEQFVEKTAEIEKRISDSTKADFTRTSQMLIESLQSLSIDIHKLLASDVPDTDWQKYLDGDRSIFSRNTIKLGTRKNRKNIATKFAKDKDFRESAGRFMRDFQGLMERAMHGDRGNTLSVTLISSDMGKLYVLLAQSLKKMS